MKIPYVSNKWVVVSAILVVRSVAVDMTAVATLAVIVVFGDQVVSDASVVTSNVDVTSKTCNWFV
jgi:hypothetical protein